MRLAMINLTGGSFSGGYRKYILNITPLLLKDQRIETLYLYLPQETSLEMAHHDKLQILRYPSRRPFKARRMIRQSLKKTRPDVVFIPTTRYLDTHGIQRVTLLRNMEAPTTPFGKNTFVESVKNILRAWDTRRAIESADRVIAVSDFVGDFIAEKYDVDSSKVFRVYPGVKSLSERPQRPKFLSGVKSFALTAGSIRPHRKLEDAISAWALLDTRDRIPLVIAGKPDPDSIRYQQELQSLATELAVEDLIIWTGQMEADELAWCYENCSCFLMTSYIEASPNTALEAMHYGCFIVSSSAAPMPEFFENAALYYPNGDAEQLAQQVRAFRAMSPENIKLHKQNSSHRASDFSWSSTAKSTIDVLNFF